MYRLQEIGQGANHTEPGRKKVLFVFLFVFILYGKRPEQGLDFFAFWHEDLMLNLSQCETNLRATYHPRPLPPWIEHHPVGGIEEEE